MSNRSPQGEPTWLTLREVSRITGQNTPAIRRAIQRKKYQQVKKKAGKYGEYWLIHKDEVPFNEGERENSRIKGNVLANKKGERSGEPLIGQGGTRGEHVNTVTIEFYEKQREKWDCEKGELRSGLMMYRYKYEEADRKLKLLPAPVEVVNVKLEELCQAKQEIQTKEAALVEKNEVIKAEVEHREKLSSALKEKEVKLQALEAELYQARRPWWKKVMGAVSMWR